MTACVTAFIIFQFPTGLSRCIQTHIMGWRCLPCISSAGGQRTARHHATVGDPQPHSRRRSGWGPRCRCTCTITSMDSDRYIFIYMHIYICTCSMLLAAGEVAWIYSIHSELLWTPQCSHGPFVFMYIVFHRHVHGATLAYILAVAVRESVDIQHSHYSNAVIISRDNGNASFVSSVVWAPRMCSVLNDIGRDSWDLDVT